MAPAEETSVGTPVPEGKYKLVAIALDLTGKKLIDEICHISAYCHPDKGFSQYVMPFRDVSQSSVRLHGIRVSTAFGKFRVLKEAGTGRTLKTKSEYAALCDFMQWLKETKADSDGILLAFHDNNREVVPSFLVESLNRFKIADDFFNIVPGFLNVEKFAQDLAEEPESDLKGKNLTLRALTRRLVVSNDEASDKNNRQGLSMESAKDRAKYTYQVLQKLAKCESEIMSSTKIVQNCTNREVTVQNLEKHKVLTEKVRTLRPLFIERIRKGYKERTRAVALRRYLIDAEIDYDMLKAAFEQNSGSKDDITEILKKTEVVKKENDMDELLELIMAYFKHGGDQGKKPSIKEVGQGESASNTTNESGTSASSTETDEEFEEAHDDVAEK